MEEYNINPDFKEYVDKYCTKHKIAPEQAVEHKLLKTIEMEYRHKRQDITLTDMVDAFMYGHMVKEG